MDTRTAISTARFMTMVSGDRTSTGATSRPDHRRRLRNSVAWRSTPVNHFPAPLLHWFRSGTRLPQGQESPFGLGGRGDDRMRILIVEDDAKNAAFLSK